MPYYNHDQLPPARGSGSPACAPRRRGIGFGPVRTFRVTSVRWRCRCLDEDLPRTPGRGTLGFPRGRRNSRSFARVGSARPRGVGRHPRQGVRGARVETVAAEALPLPEKFPAHRQQSISSSEARRRAGDIASVAGARRRSAPNCCSQAWLCPATNVKPRGGAREWALLGAVSRDFT